MSRVRERYKHFSKILPALWCSGIRCESSNISSSNHFNGNGHYVSDTRTYVWGRFFAYRSCHTIYLGLVPKIDMKIICEKLNYYNSRFPNLL